MTVFFWRLALSGAGAECVGCGGFFRIYGEG